MAYFSLETINANMQLLCQKLNLTKLTLRPNFLSPFVKTSVKGFELIKWKHIHLMSSVIV